MRFMVFLFLYLSSALALAQTIPLEIGIAAMNKDGSLPAREQIESFEKELGKPLNTIGWFMGINADTKELPSFPLEALQSNVREGIIPMVTLEPWSDKTKCPFDAINNGSLDDYLSQFAQAMKSYQHPIRLRFAHEMIQNDVPENNDPHPGWYPWQDYPTQYVQAFQHIYQIFKNVGADNVAFVWAPNYHVVDYTVLAKYYPGPEYVDWIGLDGYNWGGEDFDGIFKKIYLAITRHPEIFGKKPIMISEFAMTQTLDKKRTKADWIKDAFTKMQTEYPVIKSFYWFNINKEHDWRLNSSEDSWQAFKAAVYAK